MPYEYIRDDSKRRVRINVNRSISAQEIVDIMDRHAAEGTWTYGMLVDAREAVGPSDRTEVLKRIMHHASNLGSMGPLAFVTRSGPYMVTGPVYSSLVPRHALRAVEVFWDLEDAERWLQAMTP